MPTVSQGSLVMMQASRRPGNECLCLSPGGQYLVLDLPLIHWAEANLLHLLQYTAPIVWVPEPVAREIRAYGVVGSNRAGTGRQQLAGGSTGSAAVCSSAGVGPGAGRKRRDRVGTKLFQ